MTADEEGFWYPVVDKDKCIDCGMCEKSCPILNKASRKKHLMQKFMEHILTMKASELTVLQVVCFQNLQQVFLRKAVLCLAAQ